MRNVRRGTQTPDMNSDLQLQLLSSRHNKDIALVNLANVLHRAHFSADAAVVVHAALDDSDFFTSYYTLGNIYAVNTTFLFVEIEQLLEGGELYLFLSFCFFLSRLFSFRFSLNNGNKVIGGKGIKQLSHVS